eukprot:comp19250_c0_seq1/m.22034 comp19250_c0_seq1/g.22034  ORF comp19250_c0_seq1/g.22034 comp19250_c0_seq1/m.22034 type:complete len:129 (-) comp19250_c0_seq1:432-818(-)
MDQQQSLYSAPSQPMAVMPSFENQFSSPGAMFAQNSQGPSPGELSSPSAKTGGEDDVAGKRSRRLEKNREAARQCRKKKKEYVKCLEDRVRLLEQQNMALITELKKLKTLVGPPGPMPHHPGVGTPQK